MKRFVFTMILLFIWIGTATAQQTQTLEAAANPPQLTPEQQAEQEKQMEEMRAEMKKNMTAMKKVFPHLIPRIPQVTAGDKSLSFVFLNENFANKEFLAYTGLTKEKAEELDKKRQEVLSTRGRPDFLDKADSIDDPKEWEKIADREIENIGKTMAAFDDMFRKELTPEQYKKFQQIRLIKSTPNEGTDFLFDFGQYEVLAVTEEQRKKIDAIREEYTQEFGPLVERLVMIQMRSVERMAETGKWGTTEEQQKTDDKERAEAMVPLMQLHARTRAKILAVLTKEQTAQLETIIAGAPKYLAKLIDAEAAKDNSWRDSWKPGDPIPEGAVPENSGRVFPLGM